MLCCPPNRFITFYFVELEKDRGLKFFLTKDLLGRTRRGKMEEEEDGISQVREVHRKTLHESSGCRTNEEREWISSKIARSGKTKT